MKKTFAVSLCRNGILGGGIFADNEKIVYRTGKITVELKMKNGENFKFIVYARKAFLGTLEELGVKL